jgi:hypothetical protein
MATEFVKQSFQDLLLMLCAVSLNVSQLFLLTLELAMRTEVCVCA